MATPCVVEASVTQTASIIFLHGLGDSGMGWKPVGEMLSNHLPYLKWIFPNAPNKAVTLNGGTRMPAWYDILGLNQSAPEDETGIRESAKTVHDLIKKEMDKGIPSTRIVVAGFSQGGAIALFGGMTSPVKLGGILALSTYLPLFSKFSGAGVNQDTKILMCHGDADPVVNHEWGKLSYEFLKSKNLKISLKTYKNMGHSSCNEEFRDIAAFLKDVLPEKFDK